MNKKIKRTLVIGASINPARYSYLAMKMLHDYGHEVKAIGKREGVVNDIVIQTGKPELQNIDTVTLYIGPIHQPEYYSYILKLKPDRVLFNPGTENMEFEKLLLESDIKVEKACTLVMLRSGTY